MLFRTVFGCKGREGDVITMNAFDKSQKEMIQTQTPNTSLKRRFSETADDADKGEVKSVKRSRVDPGSCKDTKEKREIRRSSFPISRSLATSSVLSTSRPVLSTRRVTLDSSEAGRGMGPRVVSDDTWASMGDPRTSNTHGASKSVGLQSMDVDVALPKSAIPMPAAAAAGANWAKVVHDRNAIRSKLYSKATYQSALYSTPAFLTPTPPTTSVSSRPRTTDTWPTQKSQNPLESDTDMLSDSLRPAVRVVSVLPLHVETLLARLSLIDSKTVDHVGVVGAVYTHIRWFVCSAISGIESVELSEMIESGLDFSRPGAWVFPTKATTTTTTTTTRTRGLDTPNIITSRLVMFLKSFERLQRQRQSTCAGAGRMTLGDVTLGDAKVFLQDLKGLVRVLVGGGLDGDGGTESVMMMGLRYKVCDWLDKILP